MADENKDQDCYDALAASFSECWETKLAGIASIYSENFDTFIRQMCFSAYIDGSIAALERMKTLSSIPSDPLA